MFHMTRATAAIRAAAAIGGAVRPNSEARSAGCPILRASCARRVGKHEPNSASLASTQLPAAVSSAVYNANNQLTQWGSTAMTYDLNGNSLNDGTNSYVWDARNRMVSANSNTATFAYDPLGRRTAKTLLGANTGFVYDGVNPVQLPAQRLCQ